LFALPLVIVTVFALEPGKDSICAGGIFGP